MNYDQLLREGRSLLEKAGNPDAKIDSWYLLEHIFHVDLAHFLLDKFDEIKDEKAAGLYMTMIEKRAAGTPLAYITGSAYFMGLEFKVNENVLIPRQDTEILVENALELLKRFEKPDLLDMCTGSGCILISLLSMNENIRHAAGADISPEAAEIARENAGRLAPGRAEIILSDMFENIDGSYDMIVSNPPYIPSGDIDGLMREVRDHEPYGALDGGRDGLVFYRILASQAGKYLKDGGYILMEIGYDQGRTVPELFEAAGYSDIRVVKDLAGLDRVVIAHKRKS